MDPFSDENMPADLFEGTRYRCVRALGSGAAGEVFLVEHKGLGSIYVAKVLHPWLVQGKAGRRFRVEARALARLQYEPSIVRVFGYDVTADGRPFIVLEYLEGETLGQAIEARGTPSVILALILTWELLSALAATHAADIVHRDIRPDNLLLARRANGGTLLKVLDFGIARLLRDAHPSASRPIDPTTPGAVLGVPRFISPEGALGVPVDARADLYAAALVLYLLLTGRDPFANVEGSSELLMAHAMEEPAPPSRYAREPIPPELDAMVLRALEKDAEQRFQSADEFLEALKPIIVQLLHSAPSDYLQWSPESVSDLQASEHAEPDRDVQHPAERPVAVEASRAQLDAPYAAGQRAGVDGPGFKLVVAATFLLATVTAAALSAILVLGLGRLL